MQSAMVAYHIIMLYVHHTNWLRSIFALAW